MDVNELSTQLQAHNLPVPESWIDIEILHELLAKLIAKASSRAAPASSSERKGEGDMCGAAEQALLLKIADVRQRLAETNAAIELAEAQYNALLAESRESTLTRYLKDTPGLCDRSLSEVVEFLQALSDRIETVLASNEHAAAMQS